MNVPLPPPSCRLFAFAVLVVQSAFAEVPVAPIRETEQKQAQIQGETRQLVAALDAMLGEYERNNLSGQDVATVTRLRGSLDTLSATEMRHVVDLLQRARAVKDADATAKTAAEAFTGQKQIIVAIQRILAEHAREQEAAEISKQLHELADRQGRNLQNAIELGRMTSGAKPENFEALSQAQLETQRGEQSAIAEELKMIRGKVERFARNPDNADFADTFKTAAKQLGLVEPVAGSAADSLRAGQLFKAAADEKTSREELRTVARQIAPRDRGPEALRKAERELAQVIEDQKQLKGSTAQQRTHPEFDKWLAEKLAANDQNDALPSRFRNQPASALRENKELHDRFEKEQREKGAQLARLEDQQGELAGKTDALGQNVAELRQVANGLKDATGKMQEARGAMQDADAPQATQRQEQALARLDAAHAELKRRADEAELLATNSGDKMKDLEQLQKIADELARQEAAIAREPAPDANAQADVARRANQLAQRVPGEAPKAAQPMQAAAENAKKAEQAMQAGNAQQGRAQAQQAAQNLAEAAKQIAQELAKARAAQQQAAAASAALAALAKIIEAEQALELETVKATAQNAPAPFAALAASQGSIQKDATAFKDSLDASMPEATQSVGEAAAAMADARSQLAGAKGEPARAAEQRSIDKLLAAQQSLGTMLQQAQEALGQPMNADDMAQIAAAANQLQQAQQQIQEAQTNLQQAAQQSGQQSAQSSQQAAQQLAQAAQTAGQAAAQQGGQMSPSAQQGVQQATQQLSSATGQAMSGQNAGAQQSAQAASQSLAHAQAAMAAMQAGLSPSQGGPPMPGAQGKPRNGRGTQPGQGQGSGKISRAGNQPSEGAEGYQPGDPQAVQRGARQAALKNADFIGLPPRERAAIQQSLREKYPEEYGALVEQYLLNLANESAKK